MRRQWRVNYLDTHGDCLRQESEREPNEIEERKAHEGRARVEVVFGADQHKRSIGDSGDEERRRRPRKARYYADERVSAKVAHLVVSYFVDDLLKRNLPAVEFDHLYAVEYFVEHFESIVLTVELFDVVLFVQVGRDHVQRDEYDGRGEARNGRYAQVAPQHVNTNHYLQRRRPQHVQESDYRKK